MSWIETPGPLVGTCATGLIACGLSVTLFTAETAAGPPGDDAFADEVVDYQPGRGAAPGYTDATTALGPPERFTGEGVFPGVVSMFNAPWLDDEIVSLGEGGCLAVRFLTPVLDDAANPFGIDLLIFGNAFFVDSGGSISALFADGGTVEVSDDGVSWAAAASTADGLYPTQGWIDAGPFDDVPGTVPADFTHPVNPGFGLGDFVGRSYVEAIAMYDGSGGGVGVDLAPTGLSAISFVRVCNPRAGVTVEVDAISDVASVVPGDTNGDGIVNVDDLLDVVLQWGPLGPGTTADLDGNGMVDSDDLVLVILNWS